MAGGFSRIGNLVGGSQPGTFVLEAGGRLSGTLDGGGAVLSNTLKVADTNFGANTWELNGLDAGQVQGVVSRFRNIANLRGGLGADTFAFETGARLLDGSIEGGGAAVQNTLRGAPDGNIWSITGANAGTLSNIALGVVSTFSTIGNLTGGLGGRDRFIVESGGSLLGTIDGGVALENSLEVRTPASQFWVIDAANAGHVAGIVTRFTNVASVIGGPGNDQFILGGTLLGSIDGGGGSNTLIGANRDTTWLVTGPNVGQVSGVLRGFVNFSDLIGGTRIDQFKLQPGGTLSGSGLIDGGGGVDVLEGADADTDSLTGVREGFRGIEVLLGGTADDTFTVQEGVTFAGTLDAGGGADQVNFVGSGAIDGAVTGGSNPVGSGDTLDVSAASGSVTITLATTDFANIVGNGAGTTLVGAETVNTWRLTGPNVGTVNGVTTFANVANLCGGTASDVFAFAIGDSIGTIDGGAGSDTLDESALTTARQVTLTGLGSVDGFAGTEAAVTGGFTNLDILTGGAAADALTGLHVAATWTVAASNQYVSTNTLGFTSFETLVGGAGTDTFNVQSTTGATTINAGGGNDVITVPAWIESLPAPDHGKVEFKRGAIDEIRSIYSPRAGDDVIITGNGADIIMGGAGCDTIDAGHGDNIVFGDHGKVKRYGDHIVRIQTVNSNRGAADILRTGNGDDIIFGGAGKDSIHAGGGHGIVFGDNGKLILITWSKHEWKHEHGSEHGDDDRKAKHRANDGRRDTPEIDWMGKFTSTGTSPRSPGRATLPRTG